MATESNTQSPGLSNLTKHKSKQTEFTTHLVNIWDLKKFLQLFSYTETLLMQWTTFKIYITTVYQFTPDINSSLDTLWFTYNPKWLVMCLLVSILVQGACGSGS